MQEWYILGVGECVLFREVSSVQVWLTCEGFVPVLPGHKETPQSVSLVSMAEARHSLFSRSDS